MIRSSFVESRRLSCEISVCFGSQIVVEDDYGSHRFHYGHGSWQYAGVVPPAGLQCDGVSPVIDGFRLLQQSGYRFECDPEIDFFAVRYAALYTSRMVGAGGYTPASTFEPVVHL